jgi:hypothetical protein
MDKTIIKLFGINRFNLFGWIFVGLAMIFVTVAMALPILLSALLPGRSLSPEALLLGAIWVLLLGIFGVLLQLYCSLLADKLERQNGNAAVPRRIDDRIREA